MNLERTPDGALYEPPPGAKCSCDCGIPVDQEDFVRINGEEFFVPGHETRKDEEEHNEIRKINEEQYNKEYMPPWKLDEDKEK